MAFILNKKLDKAHFKEKLPEGKKKDFGKLYFTNETITFVEND